MTPKWPFGEAHVEGLVKKGELDLITPDRSLALKYIEQAEQHLKGSEAAHDVDPTGSFNLAYDAARKAMTALLEEAVEARGAARDIIEKASELVRVLPPFQD